MIAQDQIKSPLVGVFNSFYSSSDSLLNFASKNFIPFSKPSFASYCLHTSSRNLSKASENFKPFAVDTFLTGSKNGVHHYTKQIFLLHFQFRTLKLVRVHLPLVILDYVGSIKQTMAVNHLTFYFTEYYGYA